MRGAHVDEQRRAAFVQALAADLPGELPERVRLRLAHRTFELKWHLHVHRLRMEDEARRAAEAAASAPAGSAKNKPISRSSMAKKLQKTAETLFAQARDFHSEFPHFTTDHRTHRIAAESLQTDLTADEIETARLGFSTAGIQLVLLGLGAHLDAIKQCHPLIGRPKYWEAKVLVEIAWDEFGREGIKRVGMKSTAQDGTLIVRTCEKLIKAAGVTGSANDFVRELAKRGRKSVKLEAT